MLGTILGSGSGNSAVTNPVWILLWKILEIKTWERWFISLIILVIMRWERQNTAVTYFWTWYKWNHTVCNVFDWLLLWYSSRSLHIVLVGGSILWIYHSLSILPKMCTWVLFSVLNTTAMNILVNSSGAAIVTHSVKVHIKGFNLIHRAEGTFWASGIGVRGNGVQPEGKVFADIQDRKEIEAKNSVRPRISRNACHECCGPHSECPQNLLPMQHPRSTPSSLPFPPSSPLLCYLVPRLEKGWLRLQD